MTKRMLIQFSREAFAGIFSSGTYVDHSLPVGAECVHIEYDIETDSFLALFEHPSFIDTPELVEPARRFAHFDQITPTLHRLTIDDAYRRDVTLA